MLTTMYAKQGISIIFLRLFKSMQEALAPLLLGKMYAHVTNIK